MPDLITGDRNFASGTGRFVPYRELKLLRPVKVDNFLNLLDGDENMSLFDGYIGDKLMLIPVMRFNPGFKPLSDFPARVLLEITSRCNLNCVMCPRRNLVREKIDIAPGLFRRCVDELDGTGIDGLWLYNIGESILHPDFPELLDYVSSKNNLGAIWLSSNGQELSEYFSNMIINSEIRFMNMSVNAATRGTYKKISPEGDWDKMIANFRRFIELKDRLKKRTPFVRIQIIDQECAGGEIDDFLKTYAGTADMLSVNALEAFSKDVEANLEYAGRRERPDKKSCRRVTRQDMFIFSNGETTFCDTDYNGAFSMGNVGDKSIREIWNSDFRGKIIELNRVGRLNEVDLCRDCLDFDL